MKEFTDKENKWIKEFEKILRAIPSTLEVCANHTTTMIYDKGAKANSFKQCGDGDNIDNYAKKIYTINNSPIDPNGESL